MTDEEYTTIEQQIGYTFNNKLLLQQAFTRKSYTDETHDGENNEVLEFLGDKVLDFVVVKAFAVWYGDVNDQNEFECEFTAGKLTALKKKFVEGKTLSKYIEDLGFENYLIMGKGDIRNNVQNQSSVKEDLFEAILGAIAIDSNWDIDVLYNTVDLMLYLDYYTENYFDGEYEDVTLVQQWCQRKNGKLPTYQFMERDENTINHLINYVQPIVRTSLKQSKPRGEQGEGNIVCKLWIDDGDPFVGYGYCKSVARMEAAELAYDYLADKGLFRFTMADEIGEPSLQQAISQLNMLAQKGYFSKPNYYFEESHGKNGNPVWKCTCSIREYTNSYWYQSKSKKTAQRQVAYDMLLSILDSEDKENS